MHSMINRMSISNSRIQSSIDSDELQLSLSADEDLRERMKPKIAAVDSARSQENRLSEVSGSKKRFFSHELRRKPLTVMQPKIRYLDGTA